MQRLGFGLAATGAGGAGVGAAGRKSPEHLQLVRLHCRGHRQELRKRDRHQGPLRRVRQQRDPAFEAGGRQVGLRHRGADRAVGAPADGRQAAAQARQEQADQPGQPRSGDPGQAGQARPGQRAPGRLAVGVHHGRHQRRQGQGGAGRAADAGQRVGADLQSQLCVEAEVVRRVVPRFAVGSAAGRAGLPRQAGLFEERRPTTRKRARCCRRSGRT